MVLKRFVKIKDYRVFADFTWPNGLKPFTKFNVVYGWNGTGKTTLASLFRKMERRENVIEGTVEIESDTGNRIAGTAFDHSGLPQVRVFDRDFVAQSLEAISDGMAPPVYYIGKTTIDQAKLLQGLKAERVHIIAEKDKATKENALCEREFDKYKSAQAKAIKDVMIGSREYGAYNKSRLDAGIEKVRSRNLVALSEEEKRNFHLQRQAVPKAGIVLPDLNMSKARDIPCVVIGLLGESVASAAIDELAKNPELSSWVYAGLKIHDNKNGDCTCRFCGNTFTLARRREFENHFNDAYSSFIKRIDIVIDEVAQLKLSIRAVMSKLPHPSQLYENLAREYGSVRDCFNKEAESFCEWLGLLEQRLKEKKTNPFERMAIEGALTTGEGFAQGLAAQYEHITGIVDRHTAFADNLETTRRRAENMLVGDLLREMVCAYDEYAAKVKASRDVITSLTGSLAETNSKIAAIEREVTESRRPVDELNNELAAYLGREGFKSSRNHGVSKR